MYSEPRIFRIQVYGVLSTEMSQSKVFKIEASVSIISYLVMTFLHLEIKDVILGGQIQFILLASNNTVRASFSQFYQLMQIDLWMNWLRYVIAMQCVSFWTLLLMDKIHLIANQWNSSSIDSIELVEESVFSEIVGVQVRLSRSLGELQMLPWST